MTRQTCAVDECATPAAGARYCAQHDPLRLLIEHLRWYDGNAMGDAEWEEGLIARTRAVTRSLPPALRRAR